MYRLMTLELDEEDYAAVQQAIAAYQTGTRWPEGGCVLPENESDLAGAVLAEICRGWLEMREG